MISPKMRWEAIWLILASFGMFACGEPSESDKVGSSLVTSGLVAYWPLDNGSGTIATDASGHGNNGTLINSPTWQTGCQVNGCLSFDGTNRVDIGYTASPLFQQSSIQTAISAQAWVKLTSVSNWQVIYQLGGESNAAVLG